tara:strand:- start:106 stop:270 length:165 start_codon:yes stop_codon:yes gene_type:complete
MEFVKSVFYDICKSKSIYDLEKILDKNEVEEKYRIKTDDFPKIEFNITKSDKKK